MLYHLVLHYIRARESSHDFRGTPRTFRLASEQIKQPPHEPLENNVDFY